jgi:hypothetical protein
MFQCLAEHNIESPTEVHLTAGDFNSHIGTEQENHITPEESLHAPIRQGDPHPAHQPIIALRDDNTTMNAKSRDRLLLNLLNSTSQLVANGRLESPQNPNFPDTLTRTRTNESSNLISRTIVDYMIIGKQHWVSVRSCTIHRGSHLEIGSSPGNPTLEPCDHELITISIEIPGSPPNTSEPPDKRPERLQFHTDKLKEKPTLEKFQHALELSSTHTLGKMEDTLAQYSAANIDRETLINTLHGIFTQNLQKVATSTLGKLKNHPPHHKNTEDEHLPQPQNRQPNSDPPAVKSLKQEISEIQKQIRTASQAGHSTATIDQMYLQLKSLRIQLHDKTKQHQDQQLQTYLNRGHLHFTLRGPTLNAA